MKVHCSTPGCEGLTNRLNGRCAPCKATTVPAPAVLQLPPAPLVSVSPAGQRCAACGRAFPLLVDDVLCISCDSLLYPDAVAWPAVAS